MNRDFEVGDIVILRDDLKVGATYFSRDGKFGDKFSSRMSNNIGKEGVIVGIRNGGYAIEFDKKLDTIHTYYDEMLQSPVVGDYVFNIEVEELIEHINKKVLKNRIDKALDERDEKTFRELTEKYKSIL